MIIKPMLAGTCDDVNALRYPVLASPKLDGIRCLKIGGKVLTRALKPIPNKYIRELLEEHLPDGADGELMAGDSFQDVTSAVMSRDGTPDFCFFMFDLARLPEAGFLQRYEEMVGWCLDNPLAFVEPVEHETIGDTQELAAYEEEILGKDFEGVMLRDPQGPYKFGRSTVREGWLLKLKRFKDSEAEVLALEEQMSNQNELTTSELGYAKRSSAKEGKVPAGTLGRFQVRDIHTGQTFAIGTGEGLTAALRAEIWSRPQEYVGRVVRYKFQECGTKDLPRLPIFTGFRDKRDL